MASTYLLDPEGAVEWLRRRLARRRRQWLAGEGDWPLRVPLGPPRERDALTDRRRVQAWQEAWSRWTGPGSVEWVQRRWSRVGTQRLPVALLLPSPEAVARALGEGDAWARTEARHRILTERWPALGSRIGRHLELLTDWPEADFQRLVDLLAWFRAHPDSGLYPRQLPVPGLDSKWLEQRRGVITDLLRTLREADGATEGLTDFHRLTGLRQAPVTLRMRLLDDDLRRSCGGLGDITAPATELARLELPVRQVFIVENLQTGLAFDDLPGSVLFMGQGYSVDVFAALPWLTGLPCFYWGDLDTHGFAILDRLRRHLPQVRSVLMDADTLQTHRSLWSEEPKQSPAADLEHLTPEERRVFTGLQAHRWGTRVRLEQERIAWTHAWPQLLAACRTRD